LEFKLGDEGLLRLVLALLGGYRPGIFSSSVDTLSFDCAAGRVANVDVTSCGGVCCCVLMLVVVVVNVVVGAVVDTGEVAVDASVEDPAGDDDR